MATGTKKKSSVTSSKTVKTAKTAAKKAPAKKAKPKTTKAAAKLKKPAPKKTTVKKTAAKKPKTTKAKKPSSAAKAKQTEVVLPNRMPMRAQEKTLAWTQRLVNDLYPAAQTVSLVGAVCFVAIGATMSLFAVYDVAQPQCSYGCAAQVAGGVQTATPQSQSFVLLGALPSQINSTISIPVQITGAVDVLASLQFQAADGRQQIVPLGNSPLGNDKYSIEIRGSVLERTTHTLKVQVKFAGSSRFQIFTIGSFTAGDTGQVTPPVTAGNPVVVTPDQSERAITTGSNASHVVSIQTPRAASQAITVQTSVSGTYEAVQFFVRPVQGVNTQFVGNLPTGSSAFVLNTLALPNGTYELFAKVLRKDAQAVTSDPVVIDIFNKETIGKNGKPSDEQLRELFEISRELNQDLYENFEEGETVDEAVVGLAQQRLIQDSDQLQRLFTTYASAVQANDQTMITAATAALDKYHASVVKDALSDQNDRYIADELGVSLRENLDELKAKVDQFESLRRVRTESDSATDTDGDGISDHDEQVLYKTDPEQPDTDQDGFTDGVEIVSGFDPRDSAAQAPVIYQYPQNTLSVVESDKLLVAEVLPDIQLETPSTTQQVHTVVRGKALPNSFATLYLFSTPTIVTVRTDVDGVFQHTFTDELADGPHTAYVALTDNAGQIIAKSAPLAFTKDDLLFTLTDEVAGTAAAVSVVDADDRWSHHVVLGLSILVMGVLLLVLGIGLRSHRPNIVVEE